MSLTLAAQPGFNDVDPAQFDLGATADGDDLKAVSANAKFGIVRGEQFWGYFKHGETVPLPTSAADGYVYSRGELIYVWSVYWTGAATGACNGTQAAPARGATSGGGTLLQHGADIDQATGLVSIVASYFDGAQHNTNDGILKVVTIGLRLR